METRTLLPEIPSLWMAGGGEIFKKGIQKMALRKREIARGSVIFPLGDKAGRYYYAR